MTEIYNHWRDEFASNRIGHIDSDGIIYNHWRDEYSANRIGHVGSDGVIYNHWREEYSSNRVGHVDGKGIIYNHWREEYSAYRIGHVDSRGVVYNHWQDETGSDRVGHVTGGYTYAAGAALLLLLPGSMGATDSGVTGSISDDEWRKERVEREIELERLRNQSRIRQATYEQYAANPRIAAAAREYAQKRGKSAALMVPLLILIFSLSGFIGMDASAFLPVVLIFGAFELLVSLCSRHITYKNEFRKKVWELGEQGYGREAVKQSTPAPQPKPTPKPTPKPVPTPTPQPVQSKIVACPHCGAKARIPAGKGRISFTCPNPNCSKPYEVDS